MAFGAQTFSFAGSAVQDIFSYEASKYKEAGGREEAASYREAAALALQNAEFTKQSTAVKETQAQRQIYLAGGQTQADVAGAGFSMSGSALDVLRSGAQQGALTKQVIGQQGLITEAGYEEQASAYQHMASAADLAAKAAHKGGIGSLIGGGLSMAASLATLFI